MRKLNFLIRIIQTPILKVSKRCYLICLGLISTKQLFFLKLNVEYPKRSRSLTCFNLTWWSTTFKSQHLTPHERRNTEIFRTINICEGLFMSELIFLHSYEFYREFENKKVVKIILSQKFIFVKQVGHMALLRVNVELLFSWNLFFVSAQPCTKLTKVSKWRYKCGNT